jgi:hypothetical protein
MYEIGHLLPKENSKAIEWYLKAGTVDMAAAFRWCSLAAEKGDRRAQCYLGWMYFCGHGSSPSRSLPNCEMWYRRSAVAGFPLAQYMLGELMENGNQEIVQDAHQALFWYGEAASRGLEAGRKAYERLLEDRERRRNQPHRLDLKEAIWKGNYAEVVQLVESGVRLDSEEGFFPSWWRNLPIVHAIEMECRAYAVQNNLRIIDFLLDKMEERHVVIDDKADLVTSAVLASKFPVADLLVARGFKPKSDAFETVFEETLVEDDEEFFEKAEFLLKAGADPSKVLTRAKPVVQIKLIELAIKHARASEELLRQCGIMVQLQNSAEDAMGRGYDESLGHFTKLLATRPLDDNAIKRLRNDTHRECFKKAFHSRNIKVLDMSYRLGDFSINEVVFNPVSTAVSMGDRALVQFLLDNGCSPFESGFLTPIQIAKREGFADIIRLLEARMSQMPFGRLRKLFS